MPERDAMTDRYARQIVLPEVGIAGQTRLGAAVVAVVGAGGLGCAALQYLCAAGIGRLRVVDHDRVEESNLHRQPLYRMTDLGEPKVLAARRALQALNPATRIDALEERLTSANAPRIVAAADVVIDAGDSFAVTYVLSDACQRTSTPLVSASVLGLSGYVGAFCGGAPSYRAVFPEMPRRAGSCNESGVLGSAVGVIGTLEAHMALALVLKWQPSVLGQLLSVDFRSLRIGGFAFHGAHEPTGNRIAFITPGEVAMTDIVIDLRSPEEAPASPFPAAMRIGVEALEQADMTFPGDSRIVLCCRTGMRAWRAARALQRQGHHNVALIALG